MSITSDIVYENLTQHCSIVKQKSDREFLCRCCICGDSDTKSRATRLHFTKSTKGDKWIYHCFRCDVSGDFVGFISDREGISYKEAYKRLSNPKYDAKKIIERFKKVKKVEDIDYSTLDINLVSDCFSLEDKPEGITKQNYINTLNKFVKDRKIPEKLYIAHSGRYKGRIIIPVWDRDKLVYFQGRAISDAIEPKYLNPKVDKKGIIFNYHNFSPDKSIILCEGLIDAMMVDNNQGTSVLGTSVDKETIDNLIDLTDENIIIALDNDNAARKKINTMIEKEKNIPNKVKFFLMPDKYKDIKDLNELKVKEDINIYEFVLENSYSKLQTIIKLRL